MACRFREEAQSTYETNPGQWASSSTARVKAGPPKGRGFGTSVAGSDVNGGLRECLGSLEPLTTFESVHYFLVRFDQDWAKLFGGSPRCKLPD
jgi:hypothetical protein